MWIGAGIEADVERFGHKAWYLHRLARSGFPTPPAFCVQADAYTSAVRAARIDRRLDDIWQDAARAQPDEIGMLSRTARDLVSQIEFGRHATEVLERELARLRARDPDHPSGEHASVAVRSSSTPGAVTGPECAGVHLSALDVVGVERVVGRILACWASLFSEPALALRAHGLGADHPSMAVIVQTMVRATKSGLVTPISGTSDAIVDATFGLGEPVIAGAVEPDRYLVDRADQTLRSITIGRKDVVLLPAGEGGGGHRFADPDRRNVRVLSDDEVRGLSAMTRAIDLRFGGTHEVEWAIDAHGAHVLQARPITPGHHVDSPVIRDNVSGIGIGHGWATGRVRVVERLEELEHLCEGEVLVAAETTPEWSPHLQRSAAIIVERGDTTCHAARVAQESGVPAVVGAQGAVTYLETGMCVTVDASRGWVVPAVTCR